jgi:hypothetical protein
MKTKIPSSFLALISLLVLATLVRGALGSIGAALLIALVVVGTAFAALSKSRKFMNGFAIGLGIYGAAFFLQALLLPSYVGSRTVDAVWGAIVVVVSVLLFLSKDLDRYYAIQNAAPKNSVELTTGDS